MRRIILITGGQRSGKSTYAEELALSLSPNPIYLATAHIWDEEFRRRVRIHQQRRGPEWTNIEEEKYLSRHEVTGRVVLVDCCTLWLTNFFAEEQTAEEKPEQHGEKERRQSGEPERQSEGCLAAVKEEFDRFTRQDATFIFVTNEIGMGGTSANALQRRFTDCLGWLNQHIAAQADEVILMVSGISVRIK